MGFFDSLGEAIGSGVKAKQEKIERCKVRYERYSSDELIRKIKSQSIHNPDEMVAIRMILKERGVID